MSTHSRNLILDRSSRLLRKIKSLPAYLGAVARQRINDRNRSEYIRQASALLEGVVRPDAPRAVVAFCHSGFLGELGLYSLIGNRLAAREVAPVYLSPALRLTPYKNLDLASVEGSLIRHRRTLYTRPWSVHAPLRFVWRVDMVNGVAEAEGINFSPAVLGMLRRDFKRYEINFETLEVQQAVTELIRSADAALGICIDLTERFGTSGVPVRILCAELNYVPGGIFNIFCAKRGHQYGIEFIDFGAAYAHYFDVGDRRTQIYAAHNLTRHGTHTRLEPVPKRFHEWLQNGQDGSSALRYVQEIVLQDRLGPHSANHSTDVLNRLAAHRAAGGKVICLFGHMSFDLAGLHDRGPAHGDMVDWLRDAIDTLSNRTDILLLIKPHIGEVRHKANQRPNQYLRDLLPAPLPHNVVNLEPDWFNAHELYPYLDLGLVWRSTVALELIVAGIPAIVCCDEAFYWRALEGLLIVPRDREHFHRILTDTDPPTVTAQLQERAALLLRHITERTFIPLPYLIRRETDGRRLPPVWNQEYLQRFLAEGDPQVERVCDEILA